VDAAKNHVLRFISRVTFVKIFNRISLLVFGDMARYAVNSNEVTAR